MKKKLGAAIFTLITTVHLFCAEVEPAARATENEATINSFFPREEGSANERKLFSFIEADLKAAGIRFSRTSFTSSLAYHSFSAAVVVNLPGAKEDTLLLTIPVNHPPGATGEKAGSVNIALGLALIKHLSSRKLPISVQINFMGAEFGETAAYPLGTRLYLENFFPAYPVMTLYLNFENIPERIYIQCGGRNIVSPYWMITRTTEALHNAGLSFLVKGNENQLFRFGLNSGSSLLDPTLERDFPSLSLTGSSSQPAATTSTAWYTLALDFFDNYLEQFSAGIPQDWDRHYLLFQAKRFFLIINEQLYLIILSAIMSFSLIYILIFTRMFKGIIKIFFRHFWQMVLIFGLIFGFVYLSSLSLGALSAYRGNPDLWRAAPLLFLLLKVVIIFFLFILCRKFFTFSRFTNNRIFYSAGGLIMLLTNTIVIAIINISFTYYFIWAFLFFLLSNIMKGRLIKYLLFLPSAYWIVKTMIEFFLIPQPDFCSSLLLSDIPLSLFISVLLLPFVLHSIAIFKKWRLNLGKFLHNILLSGLGLLMLGILVYLLIFPMYSEHNPQLVNARQLIDLNESSNNLELKSIGRLGEINIWVGDETYYIDTRAKKYSILMESVPELLTIEDNQQAFLDRKNINLSLVTRTPPQKVYLVVSSGREFTLFDSNFPFIRKQKGTEYEILIGINPPRPLPVELTLPAGYSYNISLRLEYSNFPFRFELTGDNKIFIPSLVLIKDILIDT